MPPKCPGEGRREQGAAPRSGGGSGLTSVIQVVMVLLVFDGQVRLAAESAERQQPRAAPGDGGDPWRLQAGGVRWQLDRGPVSGVREVLCLELLLLQYNQR